MQKAPLPQKLTPARWIKKFPMNLTENDNCLVDFACSHCGERDRFTICMSAFITLSDAGTDDHGDTDWDELCDCRCVGCDLTGIVSDFQIEGLDAALTKHRQDHEQT